MAIVNAAGPGTINVLEATALSGNGTIEWAPAPEILYQRPDLRYGLSASPREALLSRNPEKVLHSNQFAVDRVCPLLGDAVVASFL